MKSKNIVSAVLLFFVLLSVVYLVAGELRPGSEPDSNKDGTGTPETLKTDPGATAAAASEASPTSKDTVIAYYFHGDVRCKTCLAIEEYAHEALTDAFPDELASGRLQWKVINFDERQNEHFLRDYELVTSSLVLVDMRGGEQKSWKTVEEVWDLVSDKPAFLEFVEDETRAYLEQSP